MFYGDIKVMFMWVVEDAHGSARAHRLKLGVFVCNECSLLIVVIACHDDFGCKGGIGKMEGVASFMWCNGNYCNIV